MRIYRQDDGDIVFDGEGDVVISNTDHAVFVENDVKNMVITRFVFVNSNMSFFEKLKTIFRVLFIKNSKGNVGIQFKGK